MYSFVIIFNPPYLEVGLSCLSDFVFGKNCCGEWNYYVSFSLKYCSISYFFLTIMLFVWKDCLILKAMLHPPPHCFHSQGFLHWFLYGKAHWITLVWHIFTCTIFYIFISVCRGKFEIISFTFKREDINKQKFEVEGRI